MNQKAGLPDQPTGHRKKVSFAMFLVTIGIVYGDIGTSPLYVMKSILEGNGGITGVDEAFIIGSLSLVIWTITLLTTVKYVLIAMKADNHGEGGIFSLYSLVRHCGKWLIVPAMLGGAALLADGVLTPAVTVTTAIEGLRTLDLGYKIVGPGVAGIDGFYYRSSFERYHDLALINNTNAQELCDDLEKKTGIPVVLMDANDIDQNQLGKGTGFPLTDDQIQDALKDNPSGQGDELTPLILIRPL